MRLRLWERPREGGEFHLSSQVCGLEFFNPVLTAGIRLLLLIMSGTRGDMLSLTPVMVLLSRATAVYTPIRQSSLSAEHEAGLCTGRAHARRASPMPS